MRFALDTDRMREISTHMVTRTKKGQIGIIIAVLTCLIAIAAYCFFHTNADSLKRTIHARDIESVHALGMVAMMTILTIAGGIAFGTWRSCNVTAGTRLDQELTLTDQELIYTFRPLGFYNPNTRVVTIIELDNLETEHDVNSGIVTLTGIVYTMLCRNMDVDWPETVRDMTRINTYQMPDAFVPNPGVLLAQIARRRKNPQ